MKKIVLIIIILAPLLSCCAKDPASFNTEIETESNNITAVITIENTEESTLGEIIMKIEEAITTTPEKITDNEDETERKITINTITTTKCTGETIENEVIIEPKTSNDEIKKVRTNKEVVDLFETDKELFEKVKDIFEKHDFELHIFNTHGETETFKDYSIDANISFTFSGLYYNYKKEYFSIEHLEGYEIIQEIFEKYNLNNIFPFVDILSYNPRTVLRGVQIDISTAYTPRQRIVYIDKGSSFWRGSDNELEIEDNDGYGSIILDDNWLYDKTRPMAE